MSRVVRITSVVRAEQMVEFPADVLAAVRDVNVFEEPFSEDAHSKT